MVPALLTLLTMAHGPKPVQVVPQMEIPPRRMVLLERIMGKQVPLVYRYLVTETGIFHNLSLSGPLYCTTAKA